MKHLFIIASLLLCSACKGQSKGEANTFYNKDFNWTINIPNGLKVMSAEENEKLRQKGKDVIEKSEGVKIEDQTKILFSYRPDQFNYFEANEQAFDVSKDGDHAASCREVDAVLFDTFRSQFPKEIKLDSTMRTEVIDKLVFQRLLVQVTFPNARVMKMYMFSRLFDKKELTISIAYMDEKKGASYLNAFRNSKFGK